MVHRIALVLLLLASSAHAATYTVSSSADSGAGTLRQAILDANANPGADNIVFTTATVVATDSMPEITDVVHIDGSVGSGRVDIQGISTLFTFAFSFPSFIGDASGSSLTRVSVRVYPQPLHLDSGNVTVSDSAFENHSRIGGDANTIGGGNTFAVLSVTGDDNVVTGNEIGAVLVGTGGTNNRIGTIGNGNTIGAVPFSVPFPILGDVALTNAGYTFIEGNEIVSDRSVGIYLAAGFIPENGSTITGNTIHGQNTGILVYGLGIPGIYYAARILGNSIYDVGLPIDLQEFGTSPNGPTPNDPAPDADDGGNHLQNYPVLTSAIGSPGGLTVNGVLTSTPLLTYRVELFGNPAADPEARTPLTTFDVTTDAAGNASFSRLLPIPAPPDNGAITATATNQMTNDTSEVSTPVVVDLGGQLSFSPIAYDATEFQAVTLTVVRTGGSANSVTVNYTTVNGTATAPGDYTTTAGTLTFDPGVLSQTIVVPIVLDGIPEPDETFTVVLSDPTNGATIGAGTAIITIAAAVGDLSVPTASTWALIVLALGLVVVAVTRI